MSLLLWASALAITLPIAALVYAVVGGDRAGLAAVRDNLGGSVPPAQQPKPVSGPWLALGRRLTPLSYSAKLDRLLALAGRPAAMPLPRLLALKPLVAMAGAAAGFVVLLLAEFSLRYLVLAIAIVVVAYFVPDLLLRSRGQERQKAIELELPDSVDQMLIAVEAGLGFESAMARAAASGKGPFAQELVRTLQDMQLGRSRREAYTALAERTTVRDVRSFVRAVVQADAYGIGIATVLRVQAQQMRIKRRQRAEEKAMKIPVKILFPLLFCILPALFIVLLGPAVMSIVGVFT